MLNIKEMIKDIEEDYTRDVNKQDSKYALAKLWDNYYDEDPDEEMLLYNLIIARFNIKSGGVTSGQKKCIMDVLNIYNMLREDVEKYLDVEDNMMLSEMIEYRSCMQGKSTVLMTINNEFYCFTDGYLEKTGSSVEEMFDCLVGECREAEVIEQKLCLNSRRGIYPN